MSFLDAFYSFTMQITDSERGVYEKIRIKVPRHPNESPAFFYARIFIYAHVYQPSLEFVPGAESKGPTIRLLDLLGNMRLWVQVECPDSEKIQRAIRTHKHAEYRVYFLHDEDVERCAHSLRGSKTNWIEPVQFFRLDAEFLEALAATERSSSYWEITFVDTTAYVIANGVELETRIEAIDMWRRFQANIKNEASV